MDVQRTITLNDDEGKEAVTLTVQGDLVKVAYEGIRFSPPSIKLSDLIEAVALLNRQHGS